jgi:hypothetical protein
MPFELEINIPHSSSIVFYLLLRPFVNLVLQNPLYMLEH